MAEAGLVGDVPITLVSGPDEYLFGEEKGLLEVIEGEDPMPRLFPPYVYGLFTTAPQMGWSAGIDLSSDGPAIPSSNPTLVNNVETLANVVPILGRGPEWYRSLGTERSPGVVICTVVGDTRRAGVAELELGTPLREVIDRIGGGARPGHTIKAVLSGVANGVIPGDRLDAPLSYEGLEAAGGGLRCCRVHRLRRHGRHDRGGACGLAIPLRRVMWAVPALQVRHGRDHRRFSTGSSRVTALSTTSR